MVIQVTQIKKKLVFWIKVLAEKKWGYILHRESTEFSVGWEGTRELRLKWDRSMLISRDGWMSDSDT